MPDDDPVAAIAAAAETAEPKSKAKTARRKPSATKSEQVDIIRKGLTELFIIGAASVQIWHRDECPQDVVRGAPAMADAWAKLAERNKRIREALMSLVTVSDWGGVVMTTGMVMLPIMRRHGVLPDTFDLSGEQASGIPQSEESAPPAQSEGGFDRDAHADSHGLKPAEV